MSKTDGLDSSQEGACPADRAMATLERKLGRMVRWTIVILVAFTIHRAYQYRAAAETLQLGRDTVRTLERTVSEAERGLELARAQAALPWPADRTAAPGR